MNYSKHLDEKIAKVNQSIGVIKYLYNYLPRKALLQIYISYIRTNLDYCDVIHHKPSCDGCYCAYYSERANTDPVSTNSIFNDKVEAVQYNAALAITGCVLGTSREKLYSELGLTSLYDRRPFHRPYVYYIILNNLTPEYLRIFIHDSIRRLYAMRTDRDNVLPARTQKYRYCFFPDTSNAWNLLRSFIKSSPSLSIFNKRYMNFFIIKPSVIYGIHNPIGLSCLTPSCVGLSHLRSHKTRKPIFLLARKIRQKLWNTSYYSALCIISAL